MVRGKEVNAGQILPDLAGSRDATAELLAALSKIRLPRNPEPRRMEAAITTLLAARIEQRIPGVPEHSLRIGTAKRLYERIDNEKGLRLIEERFPGFAAFIAEGKALIDDDVRKAQADQIWLPHDQWPRSWPPPEADHLIEQARSERQARAAQGPPTSDA